MRIYTKLLIVLLAFIIIPMFFVGYTIFYNSKDEIQKEIFSKISAINSEKAKYVEDVFSHFKNDLLTLSRSDIYETVFPVLKQFVNERSNPAYMEAKKAIDRRLRSFQRNQYYIDIMLTDMDGRVIYALNPDHDFEIGTLMPDKDTVFQEVRSGPYIGDVHKTGHKEHPYSLYIATSAYDALNNTLGIVRKEIDVRHLNEYVQNNPAIRKSFETILVDKVSDGKVRFLSPLKYDPEGILTMIDIGGSQAVPAQKAALGEDGAGSSIDYRDKTILSAWQSIPSVGWGIVTKVDAEEAFRPIKKLRNLLIVIILITVFSAALAALAIARSISSPISDLRREVEIVGRGNLDYKVGINTKDEVGQLSRAFDEMVKNLKESTTSIENLNTEIAERKISEEGLKNEKAFRESSLNAISDIFYAFDKSGKFLRWNDAFKRVTGYSDAELQTMKATDFFLGDDVRRIALSVERIWKDGTAKEEANFVLKDGTSIPYEFTGSVLKDGTGNIIGFSGTGRDLSNSKKEHEMLSLALEKETKSREILLSMLADNNQIRERLEKSLDELNKAQIQLIHSEKMEAVGRMASGVAHEVKNPLGVILLGINYFEGELTAEKKDDREMLGMMKDSVRRADGIVRALLDFSRAEELKMEEHDINAVIESAISLVQHKLKLQPIESVLELGKDLPKLLMDIGKIEQVFVNLFNNAVDTMPKGGRLYVRSYLSELKQPKNKIGNREGDIFRLGEKAIIVEVVDTGVGIGEDIINKIFDPFFTTKNRTGGTGLGLSVTKSIVEMHKGVINVESKKGKGTKFTLVFKIPEKGRC